MRVIRFIAWIAVPVVFLAGCAPRPPVSTAEVVAVFRRALPSDPGDRLWREAPVHPAALMAQAIVEPRLLTPSTAEVRVQAVTDGPRLAVRLEWEDSTPNDLPGVARFTDACALQISARPEAELPAPTMGEAGRPVEITYWSAFRQASVDGRPDEIQAVYPGATVDHYPFEAAPLKEGSAERAEMERLYAPARALDNNRVVGPQSQPVEDLIAEGPGTLKPAPKAISQGRGLRTARGWAVVVTRPLPEGWAPGQRSHVAFAVWEGGVGEVASRKMHSSWIPMLIERGR